MLVDTWLYAGLWGVHARLDSRLTLIATSTLTPHRTRYIHSLFRIQINIETRQHAEPRL